VLYQVAGDILLTRAAVIAHGVGPHDNFGQGLALSLREQWPALYQDFRHYSKTRNPGAGGLWTWAGADGRRIVNLLTQDPPKSVGGHPGRASVRHVGRALRELHHLIDKENITSVALPRLATGVGGLDWSVVEPLLEQHLGKLKIPVIIYTTFIKGQAAKEPPLD
jgi:O-acetyl-ADP-ribose deacetylase (regulator of RNase III)